MRLQILLLCLFLFGLIVIVFYRKRKTQTAFYLREFAEQTKNTPVEQDDVRVIAQTTQCIVIHLMAETPGFYAGYELLQALLSAGLRYGEHHIFHYYEPSDEAEGGEKIAFSLASAIEPGTFELSEMGSITCPGLTLFMEYSTKSMKNPMDTLSLMLETAGQLLEDLGGTLLTDKRTPLTEQTIKHWRMQFDAYQQRKAMGDLLTAPSSV